MLAGNLQIESVMVAISCPPKVRMLSRNSPALKQRVEGHKGPREKPTATLLNADCFQLVPQKPVSTPLPQENRKNSCSMGSLCIQNTGERIPPRRRHGRPARQYPARARWTEDTPVSGNEKTTRRYPWLNGERFRRRARVSSFVTRNGSCAKWSVPRAGAIPCSASACRRSSATRKPSS